MLCLWRPHGKDSCIICSSHIQTHRPFVVGPHLTMSSVFANLLIITSIFPNVLKVSRVTPIFKSGNATDPANYRPIAVLALFSKILEKIVNDELTPFLDQCNILFKYQFGFRKDYSIKLAILEITDTLKTSIDNNLLTCGVFLDFSKPFDTVNHEIITAKEIT